MGLPQSAQIGIGPSAAMCLALHLRRAAPFWYRPEPALLLMFPSCVFGGLGGLSASLSQGGAAGGHVPGGGAGDGVGAGPEN